MSTPASKAPPTTQASAGAFNYAAAAKARTATAPTATPSSATSSASATPSVSGTTTPASAAQPNGKPAVAASTTDASRSGNSSSSGNKPAVTSSTPSTQSNLNPASSGASAATAASQQPQPNGTSATTPSHSRRQSAVSLAKGPAANAQRMGSINFGSVADQNSQLSSSPAAQPSSGAHLKGNQVKTFGEVEAEKTSPSAREKVMGFKTGSTDAAATPAATTGEADGSSTAAASSSAAAQPAAAPAKRVMDFNKLFQKNPAKSSAAAAPSTPAPAPAAAAGSDSPAPSAAPASGTPNASSPSAQHQQSQPPQPQHTPSHTNRPSNLRPPGQGHQGFVPQRSPSQQQHGGMQQGGRSISSAGGQPSSPYQSHHQTHGGHPQGGPQPRSPHMPHAQSHMGPMHLGSPQYMGQQQPMVYPGFQPHMYAQQQQHPHYAPPPQQHWQQAPQHQYDLSQGQPRSPRNIPASPMGAAPNGLSASASSASLSSPASARMSAMPPTPTGASPSPVHAAHIGMGQPSSARQATFGGAANAPPAGFSHSPSHSFSSGGNPMSPSARQFEPKRLSSAIAIVNPDTRAPLEVKTPIASPVTSSAVPASSTPASSTPTTPAASVASAAPATTKAKASTTQDFMAKVAAAAAEAKKKRAGGASGADTSAADAEAAKKAADEEAEKKRKAAAAEEEAKKKQQLQKEAEEKKAKEEQEAKLKAEEEAKAKQAKEKEEAERKEREAKEKREAEAAKAKAAEAEAKAKAEAEAEAKAAKQKEEQEAKQKADAEAAAAAAAAKEEPKSRPAPIDTAKASDADVKVSVSRSVADIERIAGEASSMPPTPIDGGVPRTPGIPSTPRTPGTPGFGGLPAKPMMSQLLGTGTSLKPDPDALEKRKRPSVTNLDLSTTKNAPNDAPMSAALQALGSARFIDDINKVSYPDKIMSPKPELNETAEPGKFRYDRDFLLQFMGVYKEKPQDLPALSAIGMDPSQTGGASRNGGSRRASGMGPPAPPGRAGSTGLGLGIGGGAFGKGAGNMGQFSHPKTSEERFAASSGAGGRGGAFSGPMGSFNAGARSQPLSRPGSGSSALPSREMMGTGTPVGGRSKSGRGRAPNANAGGRGPQVNSADKGGPTIPMDQVAPLALSENRWQGGRGAAAPKADSPEMVQRKVKALLNKLTLEKFDSISGQIVEWANKSVDENDGRTLRQVIALVFEKATDEAAWSEMYARLCRSLMDQLSPDVKDENLTGSDSKPVTGGALFRKYLLNRCQEDFERGWAHRDATVAAAKSKEAEDKAKKELNDAAAAAAKEAEERGEKPSETPKEAELLSEEYYEAAKAKRRGLGLVRFIGELFKLSMLTERIMHLCIKKLLANAKDPEEEEIESLCKLLTTVGRMLDVDRAKGHIDVYFQRMAEMKHSPGVNSRMQFMLQDVIDLRASNWVPRHDNAAPKTIAQIHADAAKAKAQNDAENAARAARGGPIQRGGSRRGQARGDFGQGQVGPDGWSTVAPPPRQSKVGDLSAFGKGIQRSDSNRPMGIGPQSVFAKKHQKSEDGSNPPSRTASTSNMFHLLNQGESADASAPAPAEAESSQRPKLNLAPRTKPLPSAAGNAPAEADAGKGKAAEAEEADEEEEDEEDLSDEEAKRKITNDVKEFLEVKDVNEGKLALESLPAKRRSQFVAAIVEVVVNRKLADVELVGQLLEASREAELLDDDSVAEGMKDHVAFLDDISVDVPQAYDFVARLLVASQLAQERIEALSETMEGDGLKPPKQKLLEKIESIKGE